MSSVWVKSATFTHLKQIFTYVNEHTWEKTGAGKLSLRAACCNTDLIITIKEKMIHLCCKIWWFMNVQRFKDINVEHCCYLTMNSNRFNKTFACQFMTKLLLTVCSEKPCISGVYNILVLLYFNTNTSKITAFPIWPLFSVRTNVSVRSEEIMRKTQRGSS